MIIKAKSQHYEGHNYQAWYYDNLSSHLDIVGAFIENRYPLKGWALNEECDMYLLIIEGKVKVVIEDTADIGYPGDIILVTAKNRYFLESYEKAPIKCWMIHNPPFKAEQHLTLLDRKLTDKL